MVEFFNNWMDIFINIFLLLGLGSVYILLPFKKQHNKISLLVFAGIFSGVIGLVLMNAQFNITEGFLLDTRSILLSLTGAFFGLIPGIIAAVITSAYRIYQGGNGAITGVLVIFSTMGVGLLFRQFRMNKINLKGLRVYFELYIFGVVTHLVMILCFYTLDYSVATFVLDIIFWPVMITFPLATIPLGIILLIQRRNNQNTEKIEHISNHDFLTGLNNRHFLEESILNLNKKEYFPLCVIMGDVNGLKLVNDTYGHLVGDKLLIEISNILSKNVKENQILARWGGDEFLILMPNTSLLEGNEIIINIKKMCQGSTFKQITPSISLGCSVKIDETKDINQVFSEVEELMYRNKLTDGKSIRSTFISILENTLIERKYESEHHSKNIMNFGKQLAIKLGLTQDIIDEISLIARLHDIGKIGVSESILLKTGKLSDEEYSEIKKHPEIGFRILNSIKELEHISKGVLYHHERWDGKGYPLGLSENDIPLVSRITSICDAFEVMIHGRQYQSPKSVEEAKEELVRCSGTQFDPNLVSEFIKIT